MIDPERSFGDRREPVERFFKSRKINYRTDGDVTAFGKVPVLPTLDDLRDECPFLTPNIVQGSYTTVEQYVGTQFHLLREDYIAPFRNGIQMYRKLFFQGNEMRRGTLRRIEGVNFYPEVKFARMERVKAPPGSVVLRLAWAEWNFVDWRNTDRLKSGSLLGLSRDHFETVRLAVVSPRQTPELLQRGLLIVEVLDNKRINMNHHTWIVVENSSAYFEAYHHNLRVIQEINPRNFPLRRYLAFAERTVLPPSFCKDIKSLDFSPIMKKKAHMVGDISNWPSKSQTILNEQQYSAMKSAFNRELCVIQGPPGTGKTFVALRIVEMLLLNAVTKRPILVICYTNHALDQFLEGMLEYTTEIVRVGGNSKSEKLKRFVLRELVENLDGSKARLEELDTYRGFCMSRLDQLTGDAILDDEEVCLDTDLLDKFLELDQSGNLPAQQTNPVKLKRDVNFLRDQDRGQVERRQKHFVAQQLIEEDKYQRQRKVVQQNLKNSNNRQPPRAQVFKIQQKQKTGCKLNMKQRWVLYRHEHWRFLRSWAADYVAKCLTLEKSNGIYSASEQINQQESLLSQAESLLRRRIKEIDYHRQRILLQRPKINKAIAKKELVASARVVGMTTTGAAKFKNLVNFARPQILIVEEAAEVLESHLIASFTESTKQLILIGDHQQLQPSTAVHRLAVEFGMEVSMFERLVRNGIDYVKLQEQHRMRDEFLPLLVPHIYQNYFSHSDVDSYPPLRGTTTNMFFMKHSHKESADPNAHSKSNTFEARMVVRLAYHFRQEGYKESEITILATYRGQVAAIEEEVTNFCENFDFTEMQDVEKHSRGPDRRRNTVIERVPVNPALPLSPFEGMRITTVDNYQGEENKIIIVSLVRSNTEAKIGFLSRENRVCVALSRAKHGLFCIGDIPLLARASPLWAHISNVLEKQNKIANGFKVKCETHGTEKVIRQPFEFDLYSKVGCGVICGKDLPCGHSCHHACHREDLTHEDAHKCDQKCSKTHPCGHLCLKFCCEPCGACQARTLKTLKCGHIAKARCSDTVKCWKNIIWSPPCGHDVSIPCCFKGKADLVCGKPVTLSFPCGHHLRASCDVKILDDTCQTCKEAPKGRRR